MITSDRLSLFTVATGPRGSDKTLLLTFLQCQRLIKAWILNTYLGGNQKIFSNYPVGFWFKPPAGNDGENHKAVYLAPLPFNMDAIYILDQELSDCWVFIDEIDQWADRQEWQAVTQKLLTAAFQLIRKRKMNIVASIQDFKWLNSRLQFQTDIVAKCREAAFSPWGRSQNLDLGEIGYLTWLDKSGVMTGYTSDESGQSVSNMFHGKQFWNCYDTYYQFDPMEAKTRYKLKLPTRDIIVGEKQNGVRNVTISSKKKDGEQVAIHHVIADLQEAGEFSIKSTDFWDKVSALLGHPANKTGGGHYLKTLGVGKTITGQYGVAKYHFAEVVA